VVQLLREFSQTGGTQAVFAERSRRTESFTFRLFYHVYKTLHRSLTGVSVRVGNFSVLPRAHLGALVVTSELWNHYAAALFNSKLPFTMVPIARGYRIAGVSQMNFVGLVTHGLSAISVFGDRAGVRIMIACMAGSLLAGAGIVAVVLVRLLTSQAIPGWATYAAGALAILMVQFLAIAASFTFATLSGRTSVGFIPLRDCPLFVEETTAVHPL
jgi:hypothetical protein